jgi:hypothetical protein
MIDNALNSGRLPLVSQLEVTSIRRTNQYLEANPLVVMADIKALAVAELGCKTRIVTINHESQLVRAHAVRDALWPLISGQKCLVTSEAMTDPELLTIHLPYRIDKNRFVISADFTRATDEISHEVLDRFCDYAGIDPVLVHRGQSLDGVPIKTGTPMGMPAGWTILSVIHYVCAHLADRQHAFRIKGDDLIAYWTLGQYDHYKRNCRSVGLHVNDKTSVGLTYGTFCEGDYMISKGKGENPSKLVRLPTFSLRSFVSDSPLSHDAVEVITRRGVPIETLILLQRRAHRRWFALASELGVNPYTPVQLGGLGFASKPDRKLDVRSSCLLNHVHNGIRTVNPSISHMKLAPFAKAVQSLIETLEYIAERRDIPYCSHEFVKHKDTIDGRLIATASFDDATHGVIQPQRPFPTPGRYVRKQSRYSRLCARKYGGRPTNGDTVGKAYDVVRRLVPKETSFLHVYGQYIEEDPYAEPDPGSSAGVG